jgi:hypothetical protein
MPRPLRQICALLGIATMLLASLPAGASVVVNDPVADDACCTDDPLCATSDEADGSDPPHDEDCCPSGCNNCYLHCCNGPLSLHAFSTRLDIDLSTRCTGPEDDNRRLPTHTRAVYHPPRR